MNRPPKKWWYSTVKKLSRLPRISDPKKAAGWLWYHHLTPEKKIVELSKKDLQQELLKYYTGIQGHNSTCKAYEENTASGAGKMKKSRKAKTHKTKRRVTAKQRKALQAGRKILKHLRRGRKISPAKEPIIIKEGFLMAAKKHKKAKFHGLEGRKHSRKHGLRMHGAAGGFDIVGLGTDLVGLLLGAITGSAIAGFIPIKSLYLKAAVPLAIGATAVSIPQLAKIRLMQRAGLGALAIGGYALTKMLLPKLPLIAGVETAEGIASAIDNLPAEEKAVLGIAPPRRSSPGEMLGETSLIEGIPGEMLGDTSMISADGESDFE